MKIHAIQTGTVRVKERQRAGTGRGVGRFLHTLRDPEWTEPLPILAWAIEHPEGVIVVDTGETGAAMDDGYFPRWHPYYRRGVRMDVRPEQEIGPRLRALGIAPGDVRIVLLTHLHTDHAGGLHHFPGRRILVSEDEARVSSGIGGRARGYLPHRWPRWFAPELVRFSSEPFGPFPESHAVTKDGTVRLLPTPGHSKGHMSVVLDAGERLFFFAGDTSYTRELLEAGTLDGICSLGGGEDAARTTLRRINRLAEDVDLVYLPSHDPGSARRLEEAIETEIREGNGNAGADPHARFRRPGHRVPAEASAGTGTGGRPRSPD